MTDRPYWCEICARKKECYGITLKPKCFVPTADRTTEPTISKMEQVDKDINVRSKDEPQTEPLPKTINGVKIADAVAWADKWLEDNSVSEMWDMIRTLRDATEWQDEPQSNADQRIQNVESVETMSCQECKHWDCPWK